MLKEDSETLVENNCYDGFNVDLIQEISQTFGFNCTIKSVAYGKYGSFNKVKQKWSGMIVELESQKADLVVGYDRNQNIRPE